MSNNPDEIIIGGTEYSSDKKALKRLIKRAPDTEGLVAFVEDDNEIWVILLKNEKPIAKVQANWVTQCAAQLIEDVQNHLSR